MSASGSGETLDRIRAVRDRLEQRFTVFEKTAFREIEARIVEQKEVLKSGLAEKDASDAEVRRVRELESGLNVLREALNAAEEEKRTLRTRGLDLEARLREASEDASGREELAVLEKNLELLKARVKMLGETAESQAGRIKDLTAEKELLADSIRTLGAAAGPGIDPAEVTRLRQSFLDVQGKRQKSAGRWRTWLRKHRDMRIRLREYVRHNAEASMQIAKLAGELDASQELIAEMKDEIRSLGSMNSADFIIFGRPEDKKS